MPKDTELEPQTNLPDAPPDDPPIEKITDEEAQEKYDHPEDDSFEDKESAEKLAKEIGFETSPEEEGAAEADAEGTADAEVADAADDSASEEPEKTSDPEPKTEAPAIDASLKEAAGQLGVPDYMIDSLPKENLERFVRESYLKSGKAQQQSEAKPEPKPEPEPTVAEFKAQLDPEMFDEGARAALESEFQRIHTQHQSDMAAMRKQYGDMRTQMDADSQRAQAESAIQERARFDEWVALKEDAALFGKGASSAMDTRSAEYRARSDVWDMKDTLVAGIQARGGIMPPENQLLEWANNSVHARKNGTQAVAEVGKTLKKNASQTLARAGTNRPKKVDELAELDAGFEEMARNDPELIEGLEQDSDEGADF